MNAADDHIPDDDGLIAAEYVLGVLPEGERRRAAARIESDPAFARVVDRWEEQLSPMAAAYGEIEAPAGTKAAIDRRLFGAGEERTRGSLWSSLAFWRGLAVAAVAALVVAMAVQFMVPAGQTPGQRLVASLAHDDTDVHYFVVYDAKTADIGLSHVTGARAEGRDFELWVIEGDNPPASLGVIPVGSSVHLKASDQSRRAIASGAVFAISLEPPGGSTTGEPTGPVVALGDLRDI